MTAVRASAPRLQPDEFVRPMGVQRSDALRLSPEPGDAALIRDLRADAAMRENYVAELEGKLVEAHEQTIPAITFCDPNMRFVEVGSVVKALCKAGHRVRYEGAFDDFGAFMLTISVVVRSA